MAGDTPQVGARVVVSGEVQGVFFRDTMRRLASRAGVTGWVRNLPDGRVEALVEGEEGAVRRLVEWCHQGPPDARVTDVAVEWTAATGNYERFGIERTPRGDR